MTGQAQNRSASWGVAAAVVLLIALAVTFLVFYCFGIWKRALHPWLLVDLKGCLVLLDRKTSLL